MSPRPTPTPRASAVITKRAVTVASSLEVLPRSASTATATNRMTRPLFHLLAECTGPAVVCFAIENITGDLISHNPLTKLIYIYVSVVLDKFLCTINSVDIFQEAFEGLDERFIGGASHELQRFDALGSQGNGRIGNDMRNHVTGGKIIIRCRGVTMC